jgi:hypothetical protein
MALTALFPKAENVEQIIAIANNDDFVRELMVTIKKPSLMKLIRPLNIAINHILLCKKTQKTFNLKLVVSIIVITILLFYQKGLAMHKSIMQKIGFFVILFSSVNTSAMTEKIWNHFFVQYPLEYGIAAISATLMMAGIVYHHYTHYLLPHESMIEQCRATYKKMYHDINEYHTFYHHDVQISDWELKECIVHDTKNRYPFMTYYTSLIKASWTLQSNIILLNNQVIEIRKHKKQLLCNVNSDTTAHLLEMLVQLEKKGLNLQEYAIRTLSLIKILKNKIKLCKEYNDDCHNWSQAERNKKELLSQEQYC